MIRYISGYLLVTFSDRLLAKVALTSVMLLILCNKFGLCHLFVIAIYFAVPRKKKLKDKLPNGYGC